MTDFQRWCVQFLDAQGSYTPALQNPDFLDIFTKSEPDRVTWYYASMFILGCMAALRDQADDDKRPSQAASELYFLSKAHVAITEQYHLRGATVS